jgi:hypothetical protein
MKEEIDLTLQQFELFSVREFDDRMEYTFWKKANFDIEKVNLNEGQQSNCSRKLKLKTPNSPMDSMKLLMIFLKKRH